MPISFQLNFLSKLFSFFKSKKKSQISLNVHFLSLNSKELKQLKMMINSNLKIYDFSTANSIIIPNTVEYFMFKMYYSLFLSIFLFKLIKSIKNQGVESSL